MQLLNSIGTKTVPLLAFLSKTDPSIYPHPLIVMFEALFAMNFAWIIAPGSIKTVALELRLIVLDELILESLLRLWSPFVK